VVVLVEFGWAGAPCAGAPPGADLAGAAWAGADLPGAVCAGALGAPGGAFGACGGAAQETNAITAKSRQSVPAAMQEAFIVWSP